MASVSPFRNPFVGISVAVHFDFCIHTAKQFCDGSIFDVGCMRNGNAYGFDACVLAFRVRCGYDGGGRACARFARIVDCEYSGNIRNFSISFSAWDFLIARIA